jgi:hypothetical protein
MRPAVSSGQTGFNSNIIKRRGYCKKTGPEERNQFS